MVKAPRSKGCRVCVERRIKCDQTRPTCLRCRKANRKCPGYEVVKFVDGGPSVKELYNIRNDDTERPYRESSSDSDDPSSRSDIRMARQRGPQEDPMSPISEHNWYQGNFERAALICVMCPTQYQDQLLSNFIESLRSPVVMPTFRCHSIWLGQMAQRSKRSPALVWAIRAISIAQLGKKACDEALTQTSRRVYGKALMKLNEALQDREEGLSSDSLSATVLLSIYEIFNCTATDGNSWVKHAGGAGHLIRLRGPDRHRTGSGLTVFRACRYSLVMEAFQNRQPCFLDQPEWRSMCWDIYKESAIHGVLPMANEEYFQQFVAFPGFLHEVLAMVQAPDPSTEELQATLRRGQARRQTFQDVYSRMDAEFQRSGMAPVSQQSAFNDTQFPEVYHYLDIHIASMYCGYWSVSCALNVALLGIEAKLARLYCTGRQSPDCEPDEVEEEFIMPNGATIIHRRARRPFLDAAAKIGSHPYMEENQLHARDVCKSVEFMASTPFLGPLFLVMSLRLVLRIFAGANEKSWVIKQLDMIGDRMGLAKSAVEDYKVQYAGRQSPGFAVVISSLPERTP